MGGEVSLGDLVLPLIRCAVHDGNASGFGESSQAMAEATCPVHQMRVVQRLVLTERLTPLEAKAPGAMAKGKTSVQLHPIHTIVAALQQITGAFTVPPVAPQGATFSERILGKSVVL